MLGESNVVLTSKSLVPSNLPSHEERISFLGEARGWWWLEVVEMAVKYIKTKITHIRLADPVLRLLPVPLSPLSVQVASTHDDVWLGLVLVCSAVYFAAVLTQCYSLTHSVSPSLSQYKQLALISLSLSWPGPTSTTYSAGSVLRLGSAFLFTFNR